MRKLIVIYHAVENYDVGALVRFLIKIFDDEYYKKILSDQYQLELISSKRIREVHNQSDSDFLTKISDDANYFDSILFGIHPYGLETILRNIKNNRNRFKIIGWVNDPHYFAHYIKNKNCIVQKYTKKYDPRGLSNLDYLISPSLIYFKNLNITEYDNKLIDIFYFLNTYMFKEVIPYTYDNRKSQIILSGSLKGNYTSRILFNKLREKSKEFKDLIYTLEHPGYTDNAHMTELNFYKKLSEFKGAFVGHHDFPLNFLLAKHIEVLMCGCLAFFEPNPLLESQLGLKEGVHYVSCYKDGMMIEDHLFYKNWIDSEAGEKIAKCGQEYAMENYGNKQIHNLFNFLANIK